MGVPVPRHVDELTPAWFTAALRPPVPVTAVRARTFGEGVGMLSVMARAELSYGDDGDGDGGARPPDGWPRSVVVKLPPWRSNRDLGTAWGYFLREARFYRELAADAVTCAPRCHHVGVDETDQVSVLVLADHTDGAPVDQIVGCTPADATLVVDAAARLHAAFWDHPTLATADFVPPLDDNVEARSLAQFRLAFPTFVERHGGLVGAEGIDLVERYGRSLVDLYGAWAADGPHTLVHNDLRLDNMLVLPAGVSGPRRVVFVDWQRVIRFWGEADVAYFLAGSLTMADRRRHEDDLLRRYHDGLLAHGVRDHPWAVCRARYRASLLRWLGLVTVAAGLDVANERGEALIAAMVERHVAAALDHGVADLLAG